MATKENSKSRRMKAVEGRLKRGLSSGDAPKDKPKIEFTERQKAQLLKMANTLYERADTMEEKQKVVEMFNGGKFQPDGSFVVTNGASATRVTSSGQMQEYWGDGWEDSRQSGPKRNKGVGFSLGDGTLGMTIPEMRSEVISSHSNLAPDDRPPPSSSGAAFKGLMLGLTTWLPHDSTISVGGTTGTIPERPDESEYLNLDMITLEVSWGDFNDSWYVISIHYQLLSGFIVVRLVPAYAEPQ